MELFVILYIVVGSVGFLLLHYIRKLRERPMVIPVWVIVAYYVIAVLLLGLTAYKEHGQAEFVDPFDSEPELLQPNYDWGQYDLSPNN
jgi:hypothetical protein